MLVNQRILLASGSSFSDGSIDLNDLNAGNFDFAMADSDYLYIGSDMPFNHRFFYVQTENENASTVSVEIWDGNNWVDAVDVIDQTSTVDADGVKASLLVEKIRFTAKAAGTAGNNITIMYETPYSGTDGTVADVVVVGNDITVNLENGVTLWSTVLSVLLASTEAMALVDVEFIDGYQFNPYGDQTTAIDLVGVGPLNLAGGLGTSGRMPFSQHGIISWATNRNAGWGRAATTEDIPALADGPIVYDFFWVRLSVSDDLSATTALKYLGYKFSEDHDFDNYYPDLNLTTTKAAFTTGKTNWMDQHIMGAEEIIRYLRQKGIVQSRSQILDWEQFNLASTHKTAEIIYSAFGPDYEDQRKLASKKYYESINLGIFQVDKNRTGKLEIQERARNMGLFRR